MNAKICDFGAARRDKQPMWFRPNHDRKRNPNPIRRLLSSILDGKPGGKIPDHPDRNSWASPGFVHVDLVSAEVGEVEVEERAVIEDRVEVEEGEERESNLDVGLMTTGVGTVRWTAPELLRAFREGKEGELRRPTTSRYTASIDVYGFGIILNLNLNLTPHDIDRQMLLWYYTEILSRLDLRALSSLKD